MKKVDVIGLGSCTVDFFALVPHLLQGNDKVNATKLEIHAGGVTANNLTQVARAGASTGWFGLTGTDANSKIILEAFKADKIDTSHVVQVKGEQSSLTWIPVDVHGERSIYMFPNVTAKVTPKQIRTKFAKYIKQAKHLHTEASQLPMAPVLEAMRIARAAGVKNIFDLDVDVNYFVSAGLGTEKDLAEAMSLTDVLKPCKPAAQAMTGEVGYEHIAKKLLSMGPKIVALTMGGEGCLLASADRVVRRSAYKVKVVDTTGAGDAFMGGLSYGVLQEWPLERVADFANACAALCCTKVGARAMAKRKEVEALMAKS